MARHINSIFPNRKNQAGQLLVELLIAFGLGSILLPTILTGFISGRSGKVQQIERTKALAYLKEAEEATRVFREAGWTTFAVNGTYHPQISGSTWVLAQGAESIDEFTRSIVISDAKRDLGGKIDETGGGFNDPSTKRVTLEVSWGATSVDAVTTTYYLTRYLDNLAWIQTTEADFDAGDVNGVTVTNTAGGEIQLASGGNGDWCNPSQSITTVDLSRQGVPTSVWAYEVGDGTGNRVFAGTGQNASGPTFTNTKVVGNNPPSTTPLGEFNNTKANGVFGVGDFAYITTDKNDSEVIILDLNQFTDPPTNSKYKDVGSFDSSGPTDGNSVFVSGTVGFMTAGNKFYAFDLTSKTGTRPQVGSVVTLAGTGVKIVVVGNYAYVATTGTTKMQILDISVPTSIQIVGSITSSAINSGDSRDVFINVTGTRAYLATAGSTTQNEFFIIDTTTKSSPTAISGGVFDTNGMDPQGLTVVSGNKAIIVGKDGTLQYQVIDITNEGAPIACGTGLSVSGGVNGVSSIIQSDGSGAYSYIVTGDSHNELKIILGGPGAQFSTSGSFESPTFETGSETAFNRFLATYVEPPGTDIKFQFASADPVSGSCDSANFVFVGPDADSATFFQADGGIPFDNDGVGYENPGRCFKYKVYFDTQNPGATPVFYDITVNYSP
jgi:hypothetical protein